ncbi:AMP-binding protein [Streptomyces sp. NPDC044571]|uniref:AMP-binding protein n=1 Tax=Streptomyces sp. NPDC044571 TaxID=3155371 RepID=UPI00340106BA
MTQGAEPDHSDHLHRPAVDTALHRFEQWARRAPRARAVIAGPDSLTYGQLDARANRLAHHLLAAGLPQGGLLAIGTARQAELVTALLAVLKAGGSYAVIDVEHPRTGQQQLAALTPRALLTHTAHHAGLDTGGDLRVLRLDTEAAAIADRPTGPPPRTAPAGPAAVLFTSAVSARPVPVGHARLLAAYESWAELGRLTPEDRHLITPGADLAAFAAGWTRALCSGGALVLPGRSPWKPEEIRRAVEAEQVDVLHTDPAGAARLLLRGQQAPGRGRPDPALRSLRLVTVTGDRLFLDEQDALHGSLRTGARVVNVYALAETAGTGTGSELSQLPRPLDDPEELCLIGTAFPGCRVELRGAEIHLTPPDGGDPIPTGDLGRLRPDGLLEFTGRIQDRITTGGRELDPHPVEAAIRGHRAVGAALVAETETRPGRRRLVAHLAPPAGAQARSPAADLPDIETLRDHLAGKVLPAQTPDAVFPLRVLPRTRAGREDRAALAQPRQGEPGEGAARSGGKYAAARGAELPTSCAVGCGALGMGVAGFVLYLLTGALWPGSTDLTGVPGPWAFLFFVLYLFEGAAFAAGLAFLFTGRRAMLRHGRGRALTTAAHLAVVYLLVAWWPQDNFYRLADKRDWPLQAALVYAFNIPLMIAAAIVAHFLSRRPAPPSDDGETP